MLRRPLLAALAVVPLALVARGVGAEPPAPPAAPAAAPQVAPATIATAEQAAAALAKFKEDYKAKGLKGDDKLTQKDFALGAVAKVQHPTVVDALGSVSRENDSTIRMLGTIYLGEQTALPGPAGTQVVAAMKRAADDDGLAMSGLQSIGKLRYLGARPEIRDALKSQSFALKKSALAAVARTEDLRMLDDVLQIVGLKLPNEGVAGTGAGDSGKDASSGGKEVTSEGYSWEGAEASVDTGTAGDGDQKAAEAQAKAQAAANAAAAHAGNSGGGPSAGTGGSDGGVGGKGGGGRSTKELLPQVLGVLRKLTGQQFKGPADFKKWYAENRLVVAEKMKALDEQEKAQKAAK